MSEKNQFDGLGASLAAASHNFRVPSSQPGPDIELQSERSRRTIEDFGTWMCGAVAGFLLGFVLLWAVT